MYRLSILVLGLFSLLASASADTPTATEILERMLRSNPWGLSGAEIAARLILTDRSGTKSELRFAGKSLQYDPPLSKGVIRFSSPAELAGAAFLQIQKKDGDDERFLFLPELKRSRRIAGNLRSGAFMGTDFSFADLDQRDLRSAAASLKGEEKVANFPCYRIEALPSARDSSYSRAELWVRQDNYLPLRIQFYDRSKALLKTFEAVEIKRVQGAWFISKSRMVNHQQKHATELVLEQIVAQAKVTEEEFSLRALERL